MKFHSTFVCKVRRVYFFLSTHPSFSSLTKAGALKFVAIAQLLTEFTLTHHSKFNVLDPFAYRFNRFIIS